MNSYIEIDMLTGEKVKLTLTLKRLLKIKSINTELYEDVNRIMIKGYSDIEDIVKIIYAGYLCAIDDEVPTKPMTYEDFIGKCPQDINDLLNAYLDLILPKKK